MLFRLLRLFMQVMLNDSGTVRPDCHDADTWACGLVIVVVVLTALTVIGGVVGGLAYLLIG